MPVRAVYVLSDELHARLVRHSERCRDASEVETARRLIDVALGSKETSCEAEAYLRSIPLLDEALRAAAMHPQVMSIERTNVGAKVTCADGHHFEIGGKL